MRLTREEARRCLRQALTERGKSPIGTPLQRSYAALYESPTTAAATTFWGEDMQVVLPELVSCEIYAYGFIEPALTALLIEIVAAGDVVYDVGAHLGYHSLLAHALGADVHAFEPSRQTSALLCSNLPAEVNVESAALWDEETTLSFKDFGPAHSAVNTLLSAKDTSVGEPEEIYEIQATTLDRHVERTGAVPHLIKVDAEGAELQVLRGAEATIRSARPCVTLEVGDTPGAPTSRRALDLVLAWDYIPYDLTDAGPEAHVLQDVYAYGNILLVPRGSEPPVVRWL